VDNLDVLLAVLDGIRTAGADADGRRGPVLVELSVVERRYHAVMEVLAGATRRMWPPGMA
jgi:hypothetical protein